jgi:hypothetical protein
MKVISAVALAAVLGIVSVKGDWVLEWEDQFDGGNINDRWNFEVNCIGELS